MELTEQRISHFSRKMVKLQSVLPVLVNHFLKAQTVIEIDYSLTPGAFEVLTNFIDDSTWVELLLEHGCWCAKLDPDSSQIALGGPTQVDELDAICKKWAQSRSCTRLSGNSCSSYNHQQASMLHYEMEYVYGLNDAICPDTDACLSETCQVDMFYVKELVEWKENNNQFIPVVGTVCRVGSGGTGLHSYCESLTTTER